MKKNKKFLFKLLKTPSPSGFEEEALKVWKNYIPEDYIVNEIKYGSIVATKNKSGVNIGLFSHIDEIGLMVNYINDEGFIYVVKLGGWDNANLIGRKVCIHNENGNISGVIARKPIHLLEDDEEEVPELSELPIDIGALNAEDAKKIISIGDPITIIEEPSWLMNNRVVGRGLDDKAGCWIVGEVLQEDYNSNVMGIISTQEELGCFGAGIVVSGNINLDMAIVIDVMFCSDTPGIDKEDVGDIRLGAGPIISLGPAVDKSMSKKLIQLAKENNIPYQLDVRADYTGTDADSIFTKKGGISTALVSIPNRYMHSPVEMVQFNDLENCVKLIKAFIGAF